MESSVAPTSPATQQANLEYNPAVESLIKGIGEKALSLSWLHNRSQKYYAYWTNVLAIPTIVLSTIAGAGSIGFGSSADVSMALGGVSIIVSIISTLNSYFAFAKRAESHRLTAISYSKLYLQISIELSLPRKKRMNVKDFMKTVSEQIQRLNEIQPQVPDIAIGEYNKKFVNEPPTISRPEIVNGLVDIKIYSDSMEIPVVSEPPKEEALKIELPIVERMPVEVRPVAAPKKKLPFH